MPKYLLVDSELRAVTCDSAEWTSPSMQTICAELARFAVSDAVRVAVITAETVCERLASTSTVLAAMALRSAICSSKTLADLLAWASTDKVLTESNTAV